MVFYGGTSQEGEHLRFVVPVGVFNDCSIGKCILPCVFVAPAALYGVAQCLC